MINLRIRQLLTNKGVQKPFLWLRKRGIVHATAHRLLANKAKRISLDHMNIICKGINCTPNDLFEWMPDDTGPALPSTHHLHSIAPRVALRLLQKLKDLTEEEIEELEKKIPK